MHFSSYARIRTPARGHCSNSLLLANMHKQLVSGVWLELCSCCYITGNIIQMVLPPGRTGSSPLSYQATIEIRSHSSFPYDTLREPQASADEASNPHFLPNTDTDYIFCNYGNVSNNNGGFLSLTLLQVSGCHLSFPRRVEDELEFPPSVYISSSYYIFN